MILQSTFLLFTTTLPRDWHIYYYLYTVGLVTNEQMMRIGVPIDILKAAYCFFVLYIIVVLQTRDPAAMRCVEAAASVVIFKLVSLVFLSQRWHGRMNQWVLDSVISTSHAITLCMIAI